MTSSTDDLHTALHRDVTRVDEKGFDPAVEPTVLPALAALGAFLSPDKRSDRSRYHGDVIKDLLYRSIDVTAVKLVELLASGPEQIRDGLREMLGIGEKRLFGGRGKRYNRAGPLLGYPNGYDGLRKAERHKTELTELIINELANALLTIANESGFEWEPSELEVARSPFEAAKRRQRWTAGERALTSSLIGRALFRELEALRIEGFDAVASKRTVIPTLTGIAHAAFHSEADKARYAASEVEAILIWALDQMENAGHAQGTLEAIGLGDARGLSLDERRERAAPYFGYRDGRHFDKSHHEARFAYFVRNQLVRLAAEVEYWDRPKDPSAEP